MRRWLLLGLGGWSLLNSLVVLANPLYTESPAPPDAAPIHYQGQFSDGNLSLVLTSAKPPHYQGELHVNGQHYPVTAQVFAQQLRGSFDTSDGQFQFSLSPNGEDWLLDSDGHQYHLSRTDTPLAVTSPNPLNSPGYAAAVPPPAHPLAEHRSLSSQISYEFQLFMSAFKEWLGTTGADPQTGGLVTQRLIPLSLSLKEKLTRQGFLSSQMGTLVTLNTLETQVFRQFATLDNKGARLFEQWHLMLTHMQTFSNRPDDTQDHDNLARLFHDHLPAAVQSTQGFAKNWVVLVQAVDKIAYHAEETTGPHAPSPNNSPLNPSKVLKWETLRNMSQMMRDAMSILNGTGK